MAIDIAGFRSTSRTTYSVLSDFVETSASSCPLRASNAVDRTLKEIACWMYDSRTFNIVLTPNYDALHRNHYHVDLTAGSHFVGAELPVPTRAPTQGEHTDEVLRAVLGKSDAEITALRDGGTLG